jgi:hypothetical protein
MDITENGVTISIKHRDGKNIRMTIQPPDDDPDDEIEPEIEKFEAKDAEDLKDKHLDAYVFFEKYAMPRKGRQQGFGAAFPGMAGPGMPAMPRFFIRQAPFANRGFGFGGGMFGADDLADNNNNADQTKRLSELNAELRKLTEALRQLAEKSPIDQRKLRELSKQLQDVQKRMGETLKNKSGDDADEIAGDDDDDVVGP